MASQKIKIAVVMHNYFPDAVRERREIDALLQKGFEVHVFCLKKRDQLKKENIDNLSIRRFSIFHKRASKFRYITEYFLFTFIVFFVLPFKHLKYRYNLFQTHNIPDFLVITALLPRLIKKSKILLDIRDPMPETFQFRFNLSAKNFWIKCMLVIEKISVRLSNHVLTVHEQLKKVHIERGCPEDKITSIMNLPDKKIFNKRNEIYNNKKDKFIVVYTGTIGKRHGLETAILGFAHLVKKIPNLEVRILGDGEYLDELKKLVKTNQLDAFVTFSSGFVSIEEISRELIHADVGICLQEGLFGDIAFPTKVGEYLCVGLPTIVTRTKITSFYFNDDNVGFVNQGQVEEFVEKVYQLYTDFNYREKLHKGGLLFSDLMNWENEKQKYIQLIEYLIY